MTHSSPVETMQALDTPTLRQVRKDALVVLQALRRGRGGWSPHPVVRQWSGYEDALVAYINAAVSELILRKARGVFEKLPHKVHYKRPWWWTSQAVWALCKHPHQQMWPRGSRFPGKYVLISKGAMVL